jgi:hyperosmotically inducible protein
MLWVTSHGVLSQLEKGKHIMTQTQLIARLLVAASLTTASAFAFAQQEAAMASAAKTSAPTNDAAITTKVKSTLADHKEIAVTTNDGVVVLTGTVANADAGSKAIQLASAVPGVKEVKSELTVAK